MSFPSLSSMITYPLYGVYTVVQAAVSIPGNTLFYVVDKLAQQEFDAEERDNMDEYEQMYYQPVPSISKRDVQVLPGNENIPSFLQVQSVPEVQQEVSRKKVVFTDLQFDLEVDELDLIE